MKDVATAYFKIGFEQGRNSEKQRTRLAWDALKEGIDGIISTYDEPNIDSYQEGKLREAVEIKQFVEKIEEIMESGHEP